MNSNRFFLFQTFQTVLFCSDYFNFSHHHEVSAGSRADRSLYSDGDGGV